MQLLSHSDIHQVSGGITHGAIESYMAPYSFNSTLIGMSAFMAYALCTMHTEIIPIPNALGFIMQSSITEES